MFTDVIPTILSIFAANPKPWKINKINQNQLKINSKSTLF